MIQPLKITFSTSKGDNTYTIQTPTVGDFYDIEVQKQVLGKGLYNSIIKTSTINAQHAADMIDIEAHLSVLCKDLMNNLKAKSFKDLGIQDYNQLRSVYIEKFLPWWKEINDLLKMESDNQ